MAKFITVHVVVDRSEGLRRTEKMRINVDYIILYYDNDADHRHSTGSHIMTDRRDIEVTEFADDLTEMMSNA